MLNKKFSFFLAIGLLVSCYNIIFGDENSPGKISLQVDKKIVKEFEIRRALLYRNVALDYDSAVHIQSGSSKRLLFYPQLSEGDQNVLRLIIGKIEESELDFIDMFFNVGDSITEKIEWKNEQDLIMLGINGEVTPERPRSKKINGIISLTIPEDSDNVSGDLAVNFLMPLYPENGHDNFIDIRGNFEVRVGEYRSANISAMNIDNEAKKKKHRNFALALVITSIIFALYLLK